MDYAGFYINLDRRPDLRADMEAELARVGLSQQYKRFPAILGDALGFSNPHLKPGEMGCFSSHYMLLKENLNETRHLHFIEDDVIFAPETKQAIAGIVAPGGFGDYDILYTDVLVPVLNDAYKIYKKIYDTTVSRDASGKLTRVNCVAVDLKGVLFGSTSSYFVNKNSIRKMFDVYHQEITNEPRESNDLFIRRMSNEGKLRVGCLFPFVTSVRLDHIVETDIQRNYHGNSALATHLARYSFFIGADFNKCQEYLDKYTPIPANPDHHTRILLHLLAFSLTDAFKPL